MIAPIIWKQVGGYPHFAFCETHDRLIDPVVATNAEGHAAWMCPYCAEEEFPDNDAKKIEPEPPQGFFGWNRNPHIRVTYWCPKKDCRYKANLSESLDVHIKFVHGTKEEKMPCAEGLCDKTAFDFCAQCESAMCKDHLDWKDMCPACGANAMWPNY